MLLLALMHFSNPAHVSIRLQALACKQAYGLGTAGSSVIILEVSIHKALLDNSSSPRLSASNIDLDLIVGDANLSTVDSVVGAPAVIKDLAGGTSNIVAGEPVVLVHAPWAQRQAAMG